MEDRGSKIESREWKGANCGETPKSDPQMSQMSQILRKGLYICVICAICGRIGCGN